MKLVVMTVAAIALSQELEDSGEDLSANFGEWVNKLTRGIDVVFLVSFRAHLRIYMVCYYCLKFFTNYYKCLRFSSSPIVL